MPRILILLIFLFSINFAQQKRSWNTNKAPSDFFFEFINVNEDSSNLLLLFKTTYDQLYFAKAGNEFQSGLILNVEIRDSLDFVLRKSKKVELAITDFNLTNSKIHFVEFYLKFLLPKGSYKSFLNVELLNSNRSENFFGQDIIIKDDEAIYQPICVFQQSDNTEKYSLANFGGIIPFTEKPLELFFPYNLDSLYSPIEISIIQNDKVIFHSLINTVKQLELKESDGKIFLSPSIKGKRYLQISNFNPKLHEGTIRIELSSSKSKIFFDKEVKWISKPSSLNNLEKAIELLKHIEKPEVVENLLALDEEIYLKEFYKYWLKFDSDTSNVFNDAMNEFYQRIDYADKHFSVFNKKEGSSTDRGKIFIKYGLPDEIKRYYSKLDSVKEVWFYKNLNLKFSFVDNSGTGNYLLMGSNE